MLKKKYKDSHSQKLISADDVAFRVTRWIGSIPSLAIHTVIFLGCFTLVFFGVKVEEILLVLTTVVSLEAIYLAILIQYTVNKNTENLVEVGRELDEIQEDIDEIQEDVDEIQEDVGEIQEDIVDIEKGDIQEVERDDEHKELLKHIQANLGSLIKDIEKLKSSSTKNNAK